MVSVANRELELKLQFTAEELRRVGANPALEDLTVGRPVTRTLRSIYFDTPDHRLRAQGISLRLRAIGDQWLQTIKTSRSLKNGVSEPEELETMVARPEPDLSAIDDGKVRRRIEKAVRTSLLEPQFETVVTRTTRTLHSAKGDLELALDEGVIRAGAAEDKLCEAELELKAGSPECLLETATALFAAEPIRFAEASKAERGYNLILGRRDEDAAPRKAQYPALTGQETCAQALGAFVESAAAQIMANRRAVLETDDPEAAHQLRIGLRRLRSALKAFSPLYDTAAARELARQAREVARAVGTLRDADVLIEGIYAQVAGRSKGEPGYAELREGLLAHRAAKRAEARAALDGEAWSKLRLQLALWPHAIGGDEKLQTPARGLAGAALAKGWKKVARLGADIDGLSLEQRHEMRKALKQFRYMVEFFASLYPAKAVGRFVKELKQLQDAFGYVNDVATAKQLNAIAHERCGNSREAQRAAGFVLGWHEAEAERRWVGVPEGWERLNRRKRFWR